MFKSINGMGRKRLKYLIFSSIHTKKRKNLLVCETADFRHLSKIKPLNWLGILTDYQ